MGLRDQWYENAIIYCLDVETLADSNGDGVGDFPGLTRRLDDLVGFGVTCLWLMPFYPSPNGDDRCDISDYLAIAPRKPRIRTERYGSYGLCLGGMYSVDAARSSTRAPHMARCGLGHIGSPSTWPMPTLAVARNVPCAGPMARRDMARTR
jgi:hypothetical protein